MLQPLILASGLALAAAAPAQEHDPVLRKLLDDAATASPELAQARAVVAAEQARVPQAAALGDPTLTLGIQNDGFNRIAIGEMETSFFNIMVSQPVPWPGKRGVRQQIAALDVRRAEARLERARLDLEGRVSRAYVVLLLARGQLELLEEQERLWAQGEQAARTRYEAGQVPQSDLLRTQLERARLEQRRWALQAEAVTRMAEVNRLRGHPLDEGVAIPTALRELANPTLPPEEAAQADAVARSPEMLLATLDVDQAGRRVELARKERWPDLALTAAVMPRGRLEPMWSFGVSVGLPIFAGRKQARAVEESEQRRIGDTQEAETIRQVVRLRTHERLALLAALNRTNDHYRRQVLVLSVAAARSTLVQYEVGRVPFASVLEALSGYVGDRASSLASLADAQLVAIAQRELNLDPMPAIGGGMGGAAMPGSAASKAPASAQATTPSAAAAQERAPGMKGM